jgi:hypothetical protein
METEEIIRAQKLIDKMNIGDKKCLKEIYGSEWDDVSDPRNFGKLFKKALSENVLTKIKHLGIRSTGRCDEYIRI